MMSVSLGGNTDKSVSKFVVIGFPKCGQVSMQQYLAQRYSNYRIDRPEIIWRRDGVETFKSRYHDQGVKGIIITRDPVEACWSLYWYMHHGTELRRYIKYEDYLTQKRTYQALGEGNPISCYNFEKWIKRFDVFNPIIVRLEDMKENPNFPLLNTTIGSRPAIKEKFGKMPNMTYTQRELTLKLLKKEVEDHPKPCWSSDYM